MKKRLLSAALWFYTGWYAGSFLAAFLGVPEVVGPLIGAAAAALFAGDPCEIFWTKPARTEKLSVSQTATVPVN